MATENFYEGADYGLDPDYGETFIGSEYRFPPSQFGLTTDPRVANKLKAVSDKISTGAKVIEVTAITPEILESIPQQHLKELNRLRQLVGVDLTLHGPLVEPTGISREGWDEAKRLQSERQMFSAVERGHDLDPKGNIVITFHSTSGLPEMRQRVIEKGKEKVTDVWVVDEREGRFTPLRLRENYLTGEKPNEKNEIAKLNKENWDRSLSQANFHAHGGREAILGALRPQDQEKVKELKEEMEEKGLSFADFYKMSKTEEGRKFIADLNPDAKRGSDFVLNNLNYGEIYVRDAYNELQNLFNQAWTAVQKNGTNDDKRKLEKYKEEISRKIPSFDDPAKVAEFAEEVNRGLKVLNTLSTAPKIYRPLNEFVVDKAAETFSNLALNAYDKFKDNAPIISIENPPAGGGLSRGEDLKNLVEESRKKFIEKAIENGISKNEAEKQSEKLIGATWDVGHINMLKKFGYTDKEIIKETEKVAKLVKHVHLSDNFGYEHTELPMGMGNVPTKGHMEAISAFNKQVKKIIETGNWYQHFQRSPLRETFEAFGSPVYPMKLAPYWNQAGSQSGSYFAGYGQTLPEQHFSMYGSGFSTLPTELGGQVAGRSRLSGSPTE